MISGEWVRSGDTSGRGRGMYHRNREKRPMSDLKILHPLVPTPVLETFQATYLIGKELPITILR